jgi:hypothetical protein
MALQGLGRFFQRPLAPRLLINPSVRAGPGTGRRDAAIESAALHAMMHWQSGGGGISVRVAHA